MVIPDNPDFVAGFTAAAVIAAALVVVSAFRHLALAITATLIVYTIATQGASALVDWTKEANALLLENPMFCKGAAIGAVTAALLSLILQTRNRRE